MIAFNRIHFYLFNSPRMTGSAEPKLKPATVILSISMLLISSAQGLNAQNTSPFQGMMSDLEQLEQQYQRPGNPASPLVQRLESLETHLLGGPQQGSMVDRLRYLRNNPQNGYPQQGQPVQQTMPQQMPSSYPPQNYQQPYPPQQQNVQPYPQNQYPQGQPYYPPSNGLQPNQAAQAQGYQQAPLFPSNQFAQPPANQMQNGYPQYNNPPAGQTPMTGAPSQNPNWPPAAAPPLNPAPNFPNGQQLNQQVPAANQTEKFSSLPFTGSKPEGNTGQTGASLNPAPNALRPLQAAQPQGASFNPLQVAGANAANKFGTDALPLLNAFPPVVVRMEPDKSGLIAKPDYYSEVMKASKGKTIRFKQMPIPVYIQNYPDRGFMNCVLRAFENWEGRSNGAVRFSQTDNPNQARIQVVWKHLGTKADSSGCMLGAHTILKYTNKGNGSLSLMSVGAVPVPIYIPRLGPKYSVPPQVMEVNLDLIMQKEPSIRYQCLQSIVTHELGHALGLLGHSPNLADMMYPVTDEHSRLSERDLNTIEKLYQSKADIPL